MQAAQQGVEESFATRMKDTVCPSARIAPSLWQSKLLAASLPRSRCASDQVIAAVRVRLNSKYQSLHGGKAKRHPVKELTVSILEKQPVSFKRSARSCRRLGSSSMAAAKTSSCNAPGLDLIGKMPC